MDLMLINYLRFLRKFEFLTSYISTMQTVGQKVKKFVDQYKEWIVEDKQKFIDSTIIHIKSSIDKLGEALDMENPESDDPIVKEMISSIMKGNSTFLFNLYIPEHLQEYSKEIQNGITRVINNKWIERDKNYRIIKKERKGYKGTFARKSYLYDGEIMLVWK
jgi:hypothetical protein